MSKVRRSPKNFPKPPESVSEVVANELIHQLTKDSPVKTIANELIEKVTDPKESVPESKPLRLTPEEIKEIQLLNAFIRCYKAEIELGKIHRDLYLQQIDPAGKVKEFAGTIQYLTTELEQSKTKHNRLFDGIKNRLGVDITKYSYDEVTGYLTLVE